MKSYFEIPVYIERNMENELSYNDFYNASDKIVGYIVEFVKKDLLKNIPKKSICIYEIKPIAYQNSSYHIKYIIEISYEYNNDVFNEFWSFTEEDLNGNDKFKDSTIENIFINRD